MSTIGLRGAKGKRAKGDELKRNKAAIGKRIDAGTDIAVARAAAEAANKRAAAARRKLSRLEGR